MMILVYWDIRGLGEPIRMLFNYVGEQFEDRRRSYDAGDSPYASWMEFKRTTDMDLPNLPYLIDGDIKITQSNAILRYLGRKHNLCGQNEMERIRVDMAEHEVMDLHNGFFLLMYNELRLGNQCSADLRPEYVAGLPEKLAKLDKFLGDRKFIAGDSVTFPDFHLFVFLPPLFLPIWYEMLDVLALFEPGCLDVFGRLKAYCERFRQLDGIKEFLASDQFKARPVNGVSALWK